MQAGGPDRECGLYSKSELQSIAQNVKITGTGMTVILPQVIQLETKMPVHSLGNTGVDAIADPSVKMRVVKDFVSDKAGEVPKIQRAFELHAIAVVDKIKRWRTPMVFKPIAITQRQVSERKFERSFDRQAFFLAAGGPRSLVLEMGVERENGQMLSQPERNSKTGRHVFCHRPLRLSAQVQISEQDKIDSVINRSRELLLAPKLRG